MKRMLLTLSVAGLMACGGKKAEPAPAPVPPDQPTSAATAEAPVAKAPAAVEAPTGDTPPESPERITGPVAKVNGVEIPSAEFYKELDKITARGTQIPKDRVARIERNILKRLIEQELIDQAVKKDNIVVPPEEIQKGFEEYKQRFQSEEQFQNYLKHGKVTKESIEERIRQRRSLEMLLEKKGDMKVTDEEAQQFYAKNERFYTEKAGVRASHILVKLSEKATPEAEAKAMEQVKAAQERLKKGDAFEVVAKEMSQGPAAAKGGDLGFFSKGRMAKEFEEAAFAMKVGQLSDPVRTKFGFHIIKLTDKREDRKKTFDEVKEQIVKSLQNKKFFTERRKLLSELEKGAEIEKFIAEAPAPAPRAPHGMSARPEPGPKPKPATPAPKPAPAPEPAPGTKNSPE